MASLDGSDGPGSPTTVKTDDSPTAVQEASPGNSSTAPQLGASASGLSSSPSLGRPPTSFQVSKRAPKACANCHRRKVRCDAHLNADGHPCSYCRSTGHECVLLPGRRGSTYQKTKKRLAAQQAALSVTGTPNAVQTPLHKTPGTGSEQRGRRSSDARSSATSYHPTRSRSILSPPKEGDPAYPAFSAHKNHNLDGNASTSLSDEHVWVQFLDKVHDTGTRGLEHQLTAQSTPSQQFHQRMDDFDGTRENSAERETEGKARQVLIFNGETALDGAVPTIAGLQSMQNGSTVPETQQDPSLSLNHVPSFSPPPSWTTIASRKHITDLKVIPDDDKAYLLDHKKVNIFPPIEICDQLIKIFFQYIYPHLPILNRPSFVRGYKRMMSGEGVYSLFLLHAIFYAAAHHSHTDILKECGFENRLTARAYFFSRARLIHMMDGEKEHLFTIQGCTLMSMWWTRYEEEKETRYWLTAAVLLSQRMGMHRSIRSGWGLGASERRMWKRIWWTLYSRDHVTASSLGKPSLVKLNDCDVTDLEEDDFVENWGNLTEAQATELCPAQQLVTIRYAMEMSKLGKLYEKISSIQYSCSHRPSQRDLDGIANELATWKANLPPELSTVRYDEMPTWTPESFWPILLHLVHDRAISMHYRPRCSRPKGAQAWENNPNGQLTDEETLMRDREKARKAVVSSASNTFRLIEDLLRHDLLKYAPAAVQTPLFIAMIVYAEEIKLSPENSTRYNLATNKITIGMMALGELRKIWAASSWTYRLFEFIIKNKFVGIGKPEISVGGGVGAPADVVAAHTGRNPLGMYPVGGEGICEKHTDIQELIIDPQLTAEGNAQQHQHAAAQVAAAAAHVATMGGQPLNPIPESAAPTPSHMGGQPIFWNTGNPDTLSPDAAGYTMWGDQSQGMMAPQQHPTSGPEGWGAGGIPMGGQGMGGEDAGGFDLTWLAMSGLAGNLPFEGDGSGPITGGGGAVGWAGAPDMAKMAGGQPNPAKMGTAAIDLWNLLGLGEGGGAFGGGFGGFGGMGGMGGM